jgi:hypothetical protein
MGFKNFFLSIIVYISGCLSKVKGVAVGSIFSVMFLELAGIGFPSKVKGVDR